jgi:hypothetical protein
MATNPIYPTKYPNTGNIPDPNQYNGFAYIAAWSIVILLLFLAAKTKIGYTILFIFAVSSIMIVLAVGSPTIVSIFQSVSPPPTIGKTK